MTSPERLVLIADADLDRRETLRQRLAGRVFEIEVPRLVSPPRGPRSGAGPSA